MYSADAGTDAEVSTLEPHCVMIDTVHHHIYSYVAVSCGTNMAAAASSGCAQAQIESGMFSAAPVCQETLCLHALPACM